MQSLTYVFVVGGLFLLLAPLVVAVYTLTYSYTGGEQTWVVPASVLTIDVDAYGAAGTYKGGLGGHILVSNIRVASLVGTTLIINVGGQAGYNGGGIGGGGSGGGNGGGGTSLAMKSSDLVSRLVVAGGGGGGGWGAGGGAGGGSAGAAGGNWASFFGGGGGTQTAGGVSSGGGVGGLGVGGGSGWGGGGGGYYGGGGGGGNAGGGGGSSFPAFSNNPYGYTIVTNDQGTRSGDGVLYITYTSCAAGYYLSGASCLACAANRYSAAAASSCSSECPIGTFISSDASCSPCPAGKFQTSPGLQSTCQACQSGTYSPSTGQSLALTCVACAQGAVSVAGQSSCTPCSAGTYQTSSSACQPCSAGAYSAPGSIACASACPRGSYYSSNSACLFCQSGFYFPSAGLQTSCLACPSQMLSSPGSSICYKPTFSFAYTGIVQGWSVPPNLASITIDAYGASGGSLNGQSGGAGGYVSAIIPVSALVSSQLLYIYVGAHGGYSYQRNPNMIGGKGSLSSNYGGGATDIRTAFYDLSSRLVVAGGGGGAGLGIGGSGGGNTAVAGDAGSLSGVSGVGGGGGSQTMGGARAMRLSGTLGVGGASDLPVIINFATTGSQQTFVVPTAITLLKVTACGGQGAGGITTLGFGVGGLGGCVSASLTVTPGATLYIFVGSMGTASGGGASYGGGGSGHSSGGGGGGGTDVRTSANVLTSRLVVAGGGGGGSKYANGGAGGGLVGQSGCGSNQGGTQTSGGIGSGNPGTFGIGGSGTYFSGGGGGGWWGGAGANAECAGGGGSSYVNASSVIISNLQGTQTGNGYLEISYSADNIQSVSGGGGAGFWGGGGGSIYGGGGGGSSFVATNSPYFATIVSNAQGVVQPGTGNGTLYITLNCATGTDLQGGTSCLPLPSTLPTKAPLSLPTLSPSSATTLSPTLPTLLPTSLPTPTFFPTLLPASARMQLYTTGSLLVTKFSRSSHNMGACEGKIVSTKIVSLDECLLESISFDGTGDVHFKHAVKVGVGKNVKSLTRLVVVYQDSACSVPTTTQQYPPTPLIKKLGHYVNGCDIKNNEAFAYSPMHK